MEYSEEKVKELVDKNWYIQGFNAAPLLIEFAPHGAVEKMREFLGFGYSEIITSFKNDFCEFYYSKNDLDNLYEKLLDNHKKDSDYVSNLIIQSEEQYAEIEKFLTELRKQNKKEMSDEELINKLAKLLDYYILPAAIPHIVEGFSLNSDIEIKNILHTLLVEKGREKEFAKTVTKLTMPIEKSFLAKAEKDLESIKELLFNVDEEKQSDLEFLKNNQQEIYSKIKKHSEDYYWINASYAEAPENSEEKVLKQVIQKFKEKAKHESSIDKIKPEEKKEIINDLEIDGRLLTLIQLSEILTTWQDNRKKMILKCVTNVDNLLKELSTRINIPQEDLRYLTYEEITSEKIKTITKETLQARKKGCIYVYTPEQKYTFYNEDFNYFNNLLNEKENHEQIKEIPGLCASIGRAIGRVKICKSLDSINEFEEGEILVTSMTRPEYLPAMKKAAAIVTDEGGITCHAAIISREIGKPCLIATKNATKILKDGDLVEVKANHGMINIIEKA